MRSSSLVRLIGCNFVRYALANTDYRVVVVDKLTYAGDLINLEDVRGNERYTFVQAVICDRGAMAEGAKQLSDGAS
jgi:dTDP-glucose 4,6-dehydratase